MSTIQIIFYITVAVLALVLAFCAMYTWAYERGARSTMWVEPMGVHDPTPEHIAQAEEEAAIATAEEIIGNLELDTIDPSVWEIKPGRMMLLPPSRDEEIERLNEEVQRQSKLKSRYWRLLQEERTFIHTLLFSQRESDYDIVPKYWEKRIRENRMQSLIANRERNEAILMNLRAGQ